MYIYFELKTFLYSNNYNRTNYKKNGVTTTLIMKNDDREIKEYYIVIKKYNGQWHL